MSLRELVEEVSKEVAELVGCVRPQCKPGEDCLCEDDAKRLIALVSRYCREGK